MLIKDAIKMYDENLRKKDVKESQRTANHTAIVEFFTFLVDQDCEISFKDKRGIPASELTKETGNEMQTQKV